MSDVPTFNDKDDKTVFVTNFLGTERYLIGKGEYVVIYREVKYKEDDRWFPAGVFSFPSYGILPLIEILKEQFPEVFKSGE